MADESTAPQAAPPLCDLPGCGMPATKRSNDLNHCYNHESWTKTPHAELVRAQKKAGL